MGLLQDARLDQVREFATKAVPMGLWEVKSGCNLGSQHTISQFHGGRGLSVRKVDQQSRLGSDPTVYETPGAYVYGPICGNCHGRNADGHGRLATNLALMTGGKGIPSDFMGGLFGREGIRGPMRRTPSW